MEIAFYGLGRMGGNMAERALRAGHRVIACNRTPEKTRALEAKGAVAAYSVAEIASRLAAPRAVWVMVPAGDPTEQALESLADVLSPGDLLIDGGNARYTDSQRRARSLAARKLDFVDVGTSGGVWGLENGYCLMAGGEPGAVRRIEPLLRSLAPSDQGWLHVGPAGAGHFVKMVHNGIEYALMQGYAEGFEIMKAAPFPLALDRIAGLWNQGSVVRSWLLELVERALSKDPSLASLSGYVEDSGEGRWTVEQAVQSGVPAPAIADALFFRFRSRQSDSFAGKVLAALRNEFGGHAVRPR